MFAGDNRLPSLSESQEIKNVRVEKASNLNNEPQRKTYSRSDDTSIEFSSGGVVIRREDKPIKWFPLHRVYSVDVEKGEDVEGGFLS